MSRVLVTGCAGFVMSHVADHLIANGHDVIGIDDLSGGFTENIPAGVHFLKVDVCDSLAINILFKAWKPDYVIHGAAYAAEGLSHFIRKFNYETNLVGSINLINASVNYGVKGFVFLSSIAVYGHEEPPFSEGMTPEPADPYAISKYAVELDLRAACEMFGMPFVIFRPFNVYGERQNIGDAYRNVVGIFFNQCLKHEHLTIFGDGNQTRAFSHISDVAPAIAASIDMPDAWGKTFNIGGEKACSVGTLGRYICNIMGVNFSPNYLPARKEAVHAFCNTTKAREMFGSLIPGMDLFEGLEKMADWVEQHGSRSTSKFANIEIEKNLPPSWKELK